MNRRDFLRLVAVTPLATTSTIGFSNNESASSDWQTYELIYDVDLTAHRSAGRVWLPLPQDMGDYQRLIALSWSDSAPGAGLQRDRTYGANMYSAAWGKDEVVSRFSVTAKVATRNRVPSPATKCWYNQAEANLYLQPTKHIPLDGIVAKTAQSIIKPTMSPDEKARAIYDWVVDNTFRDPKTRGCGLGDIKFMLESGNLGGKCADISSLFVGLARAAGIPAREVYGVRVAPSKIMKCLGASNNISKAQHCRAEYLSPVHGWVAVDPGDVRKAVLEEKLSLADPRIRQLREYLFGNWEMNWVGFNTARDFDLGSGAGVISYLMYPYSKVENKVFDGRSPGNFKFSLTSREVRSLFELS